MDVSLRYHHRAVAHESHYSERISPSLTETGSEGVPKRMRDEIRW